MRSRNAGDNTPTRDLLSFGPFFPSMSSRPLRSRVGCLPSERTRTPSSPEAPAVGWEGGRDKTRGETSAASVGRGKFGHHFRTSRPWTGDRRTPHFPSLSEAPIPTPEPRTRFLPRWNSSGFEVVGIRRVECEGWVFSRRLVICVFQKREINLCD